MRVGGRPVGLRVRAAALSLVLVGGCAPSTPVTPAPSGGNAWTPSPTGQPAPPTGPVIAAPSTPPVSSAAGLVLAEVRFDPLPGEPPFIEIANAGSASVALAGLTLELDGKPLAIQPGASSLGPSERLLVMLDGPRDPERHVVHVAGAAPGRAAGVVQLLDGGQRRLDRVAWGRGPANAVSLTVGDFAPVTVEPGTTIGRPPGANRPYQPTEWVAYAPALASPGAPNPVPPVQVLLPIDGAVLDGSIAALSWYPVTGAASYRVQIAADDTFSSTLVDAPATEPQVSIRALAPGRYVWRVQSIGADGGTSSLSGPSGFELRAGVAQIEPAVYRGGLPGTGDQAALGDVSRQLAVPWLVQHKDTTMLLLEEPHEHAPMAWDAIHTPASRFDPADQYNCALAMVAMVNHFYGGDLSEDRIGYEQLKGRQPGPEQDLMYGIGLDIPQVNAAFAFALGEPATFVPEYATYDAAWADITAAIDAGRPVAGANTHHGFVITGYAVRNGHRILSLNDPAVGRYSQDLDASRIPSTQLGLWLLPEHPTARRQETSVTTDSDGDGVVDFDETERFHTNPNDPDSDADKVRDKQDVASGIFDPTYGYAGQPTADGPGRDFDSDGIPTERDPDSDAGGCQDGEEDKDGDGHRNGQETWNFDVSDDACHDLAGTITIERTSKLDTGSASASRQTGLETLHVTVQVVMQADPNDPTALIDAGSTFTVERVVTFERKVGGDCSPERSISRSKGTYRFGDPPVPSAGHTSAELDGFGGSKIWGAVDRGRGLMMISMVAYYPETIEATCQLFEFPGLPDVIDGWACGDTFLGLAGLGVDAKIKDQPSGPYPVVIDCTVEGHVLNWDTQKLVAKGQLTLIGH